jgi:fructoselysine 6-kinase
LRFWPPGRAQAAYLGITGNDIPAGVIHHALCAEGVDISRVRINQSFNALSQIDIDADGNRFFVGSVPPPYQLRLSEADLAWLADFDLLHTSDYSGLEAQLPQLAACAPLSFDFGSRDDAWPSRCCAGCRSPPFRAVAARRRRSS